MHVFWLHLAVGYFLTNYLIYQSTMAATKLCTVGALQVINLTDKWTICFTSTIVTYFTGHLPPIFSSSLILFASSFVPLGKIIFCNFRSGYAPCTKPRTSEIIVSGWLRTCLSEVNMWGLNCTKTTMDFHFCIWYVRLWFFDFLALKSEKRVILTLQDMNVPPPSMLYVSSQRQCFMFLRYRIWTFSPLKHALCLDHWKIIWTYNS
jgi:hypothetical protein